MFSILDSIKKYNKEQKERINIPKMNDVTILEEMF